MPYIVKRKKQKQEKHGGEVDESIRIYAHNPLPSTRRKFNENGCRKRSVCKWSSASPRCWNSMIPLVFTETFY
jgi:hypothetical protein